MWVSIDTYDNKYLIDFMKISNFKTSSHHRLQASVFPSYIISSESVVVF